MLAHAGCDAILRSIHWTAHHAVKPGIHRIPVADAGTQLFVGLFHRAVSSLFRCKTQMTACRRLDEEPLSLLFRALPSHRPDRRSIRAGRHRARSEACADPPVRGDQAHRAIFQDKNAPIGTADGWRRHPARTGGWGGIQSCLHPPRPDS